MGAEEASGPDASSTATHRGKTSRLADNAVATVRVVYLFLCREVPV